MKKLISVVLTLLTLACISLSFSGCSGCNWELEIETQGDFLYTIVYYDENGTQVVKEKGVRSGIMIMGLSEIGQEKEIVAVPEYINDLKVEQLGYEKMWSSEGCWKSEKLKKVFVPFTPVMIGGIFSGCVNLEKIIFLVHDADVYYLIGSNYIPKYITSYRYIKEEHTTNFFEFHGGNYYFSNVSFMFNYDNAPNDNYYWVDDCDYGGRIEYVPEIGRAHV